MKPQCIQAVSQAVGRSITVAESRNIEQRVRDAMTALARQDVARWQGLSTAQRLTEAAQYAAKELVAEANLKKQRIAQTILVHDRIENYTAAQVAAGYDKTQLHALRRLIAGKAANNNVTSVEANAKGIAATAMGRLVPAWDAISPRILGLLADRKAEEAFIRALFGDRSNVPPELIKAVDVWREVTESLRQRYNATGGDVGKRDNWGLPQAWDQYIAIKLGKQAFVDEFMNWVDRSVYVKPDGTPFTDAEMRDFLGEAWVTIATNGANKPIQQGQSGSGGSIKANRNNQARQIHLKDPDSAVAALQRWSGRSVFEAMAGHVSRLSRDIALVEQFSPNADLTISHFIDRYKSEAAKANPEMEGELRKEAKRVVDNYNHVAGNNPPPSDVRLANAFSWQRSWTVGSKLGSASLTSLTDEGTLYLTANVNNLPLFKTFMNEVRAFNPLDQAEKRRAMRAGLLVNTMLDDIDRFGNDTLGSQIPQKIASTVLRASGLNAMTEARRRAFSVTMLDTIGQLTREFDDVAKLDPNDWKILRSKGITPEEWAIWRAAKPDDWGQGYTVLTPERIYAIPDEAMRKAAGGSLDKMRAEANAQIAELDRRNAEEIGWIANRQAKFMGAEAEAVAKIEALQKNRIAEANAAIDAINDEIELMRASIELAQSQRVLEIAESSTESKDRIRGLIADVAGGADVMRVLEGQADSAVEAAMRRGHSVGAEMGERIGKLRAKITQLKAKARAESVAADGDVDRVAEKQGRKVGGLLEELEAFTKRSEERQSRRAAVMTRIKDGMGKSEAEYLRLARERAATKLLAVVLDERDFAVIEPGARERTKLVGSTERGTWAGELLRSFLQFKSFPIAMIIRHWERALTLNKNTSGKVGYIAALVAMQTLMGAVAMQINEIVSGRNPRSLNPENEKGGQNILAAVLKGGALSLYGDFLFADTNTYGRTLAAALAGPGMGLLEDTFKLTVGNLQQLAKGEETEFGAELARFARGYTPGANLWYTKAATDRLIFFNMQELANPGYLRRMQTSQSKFNGATYWWDPARPSRVESVDVAQAVED